ncbi:hypothetical protein B2J93_3817 [Marssonina coronariae]|uniref:Uncharacterized protein n=1 Tax=Diplocarpon coronariae TaxID=2795749 RepID=A0A218ZFF3_9HELO|nr:hypothetical protein B2J93_3817 [Marssonina coronariae]
MPGPSRLGTFPPPRGVTFHPGIDGSPALEQESPSLPACPANPAPRLGMCAATDSSNSSVVSSRHCRSPPWQTGAPSYPPAGTLAHDQGRIRRQVGVLAVSKARRTRRASLTHESSTKA